MFLVLSLLGSAIAACPSPYNAADCTDNHGDPICGLNLGTYTCTSGLGSSTNNTRATAISDYTAGTYNVFGYDSDSADFCCTVTASSVQHLILEGGAGNDNISLDHTSGDLCGFGTIQALSVEVWGLAGEDTLGGSKEWGCTTISETFWGGPGGDTIQTFGRAMNVYGEANGAWGDWLIDSGDASDPATFSATLWGGAGVDMLESVNDLGTLMYGGDALDIMYGGDGPDEMYGQAGDDEMSGGGGDDQMWGGAGNDIIAGNDGFDLLYGGYDDDTLCGGGDNGDFLWGEQDDDILEDDGGADVTDGGGGYDTCDSSTAWSASPSCNATSVMSYQCGS